MLNSCLSGIVLYKKMNNKICQQTISFIAEKVKPSSMSVNI